MKKPVEKSDLDNHANQLNPQHPSYYLSRHIPPVEAIALADAKRKEDNPVVPSPTYSAITE